MFKSPFLNEQTMLRYCCTAVFPGVGETYRDVRDELPLAVILSNHANVVLACKN